MQEQDLDIRDWQDIADNFKQADLLLGNGFSLNFSDVFHYESLFEEFINDCSEDEANLFRKFDTTNFENIQYQLLNAKKVNGYLDLPTKPIDAALEKLRDGLITAIQNKHPVSESIDFEQLAEISRTLDTFGNVFSLNYDLFLYHIIMISNDRHKSSSMVSPYQDYFWSSYSGGLLEFMDYQNYTKYKHVYYLHGALFLFPGRLFDYYNDLKLKRNPTNAHSELLEDVADMIQRGQLPLFVSEGTAEEKRGTIFGSPYLNFAYRKLREASKWLVIYGWSVSRQDDHIVSALAERSQEKRNIAVSVHVNGSDSDDLEAQMNRIRSRLPGQDIVFFDSSTLFNY